MIRDEYKKSQEVRKKSLKEIEGVKKMGERAYYTNSIKRLTANQKTLNFNTWFMLIFNFGLVAFIVILLILNFSLITKLYMIVAICFASVISIWSLVWFMFLKNHYTNKINMYKGLVEDLKKKEMDKQKSIYKMYKGIKEKNNERL